MKMSVFFRSTLAIGAAAMMSACAGSSPASPSAAVTTGATTSIADSNTQGVAHTDAQGGSLTGSAAFGLGPTPGGFGFASATENGVSGRNVPLAGDIVGTNFEPGVCHPGTDAFGLFCVIFGDGPGQFTRMAPGGVAFTTCHCTVGGVGDSGDQVILKISYPPATPPQYPGGFTKFTFQAGTGALGRLSGQGTLDFSKNPQVSFTYRFAGQ